MNCASYVRKAIKDKLGYTSKQVSVRTPTGANCFGAYVVIKDESINVEQLVLLCKSFHKCKSDPFNDYFDNNDKVIISFSNGKIVT